MSRLAVTGTAAITASLTLPPAAVWVMSAAGAPMSIAAAVAYVVVLATGTAAVRAVRRAGEHDRAEIRAAAELDRAHIRTIHQNSTGEPL